MTRDVESSSRFPTHTPQFDNTYYSTPSSGHMWACGAENNGTTHHPELWNIAFTGTPALLGAVTGSTTSINTTNHAQCSPLTEFFNTSDFLYLGEGLSGSFTDLYGFTISGTTATAITGSPITDLSIGHRRHQRYHNRQYGYASAGLEHLLRDAGEIDHRMRCHFGVLCRKADAIRSELVGRYR